MYDLIIIVFAVAGITALYKIAPYRELEGSKRAFAIFPKYKTSVRLPSGESLEALEAKLADYGFRKRRESADLVTFSRGSVLGDFSIRLLKVSFTVAKPVAPETTVKLESAWVAAFDTGDHWTLLSELREKLEGP